VLVPGGRIVISTGAGIANSVQDMINRLRAAGFTNIEVGGSVNLGGFTFWATK
jgi:methylmalonyl-CoA mutase cobalamin-binding subunit